MESKLLVIGVDAGSPELFDQWMQAGDMPNLARLKASGARGRVDNPYALEAGAVWPVFHAGLVPGHFPQYDGRRYSAWPRAVNSPSPSLTFGSTNLI